MHPCGRDRGQHRHWRGRVRLSDTDWGIAGNAQSPQKRLFEVRTKYRLASGVKS